MDRSTLVDHGDDKTSEDILVDDCIVDTMLTMVIEGQSKKRAGGEQNRQQSHISSAAARGYKYQETSTWCKGDSKVDWLTTTVQATSHPCLPRQMFWYHSSQYVLQHTDLRVSYLHKISMPWSARTFDNLSEKTSTIRVFFHLFIKFGSTTVI